MINPEHARVIVQLLDWRKQVDPKESVPVYDLHFVDGEHTNYCLVNAEWLENLYTASHGADSFMPHEHLAPGDE